MSNEEQVRWHKKNINKLLEKNRLYGLYGSYLFSKADYNSDY